MNKQPFLDLYKGTVTATGEITDVELFSKNVNTKVHESNAVFTKDLKTVYFSRDNYINKKQKKDSNDWVLIQLFKADVNEEGDFVNIENMILKMISFFIIEYYSNYYSFDRLR